MDVELPIALQNEPKNGGGTQSQQQAARRGWEAAPDTLAGTNESGPDGFFPIGEHRFWHGGVHLRGARKKVVAACDGTLVAYRIDKKLETATLDGKKVEYSTGFALVRHEVGTPLGTTIGFWSLSMHLLPWDEYVADSTLEPPIFLRADRPDKVKTDDFGKGVALIGDAAAMAPAGVVPLGAKVELTGEMPPHGHWASGKAGFVKVKWGSLAGWLNVQDGTSQPERGCQRYLATGAVTVLSPGDPAKKVGEIPPGGLFDVGGGKPSGAAWKGRGDLARTFEVKFQGPPSSLQGFALLNAAVAMERRITADSKDPGADKRGVPVYAEARRDAPVIAIIPKGTSVQFKDPFSVRFSKTTTYQEIASGGFVPVNEDTFEHHPAIAKPGDFGKVIRPPAPVQIERGDALGYTGTYRDVGPAAGQAADGLMHFEIFSESTAFFANPNHELWFSEESDDKYQLATGAQLMRSEPIPDASNARVKVNLGPNDELFISHRPAGSDHVQVVRQRVHGWRRTSELGSFRASGRTLVDDFDALYTDSPKVCWCEEPKLTKAGFAARRGESFVVQSSPAPVKETFKRVTHGKTGKNGWAREHDLGEFYAESYNPPALVDISMTAKPASWWQAIDADAASRSSIPAKAWVKPKTQQAVKQTFHKVKHEKLEGWIPSERIRGKDPAKKTITLAAEAGLLKSVPNTIQEATAARPLATLAAGSEVVDSGAAREISETWIECSFTDSKGSAAQAWSPTSRLGSLLKNQYVLGADLDDLLKAPPSTLTAMESGSAKNRQARKTMIGAKKGEGLAWDGSDSVATEQWDQIAISGHVAPVWCRSQLIAARSTRTPAHYALEKDLDFVLPAVPAQVAMGAKARDLIKVNDEVTSGGVTYGLVAFAGKAGWWPKAELGVVNPDKTCKLTDDLPYALQEAPKDPPDRVTIHALRGDRVKFLEVNKAYTNVQIVVTDPAEHWHGYLPKSAVQTNRLVDYWSVTAPRKELLTSDPNTTFVFNTVASPVNAAIEFAPPPRSSLRRDDAGHLWGEVKAGAVAGWVDLSIDPVDPKAKPQARKFANPNLSAKSAYDWEPTWEKLEESASKQAGQQFFSQDGFCDVPKLVDLLQKKGVGQAPADPETRMRELLANREWSTRLRATACFHPSEWDSDAGNGFKKWDRLKDDPWKFSGAALQEHHDFIKKLDFWKDAFKGAKPAPASPAVWHFHPLGFVKQLRRMRGVTADQLLRILGRYAKPYIAASVVPLNETLERYEITTPLLQAHFIAQVGLESARFSSWEEGVAYGKVEDSRAGRQYEWRLDLGNVREGDGEKFKGRGLVQLTGRNNYSIYGAFAHKAMSAAGYNDDLTTKPDIISKDARFAWDAAGWFWRYNDRGDLNLVAVASDEAAVRNVSIGVNGQPRAGNDPNGFEERKEFFRHAKRILMID